MNYSTSTTLRHHSQRFLRPPLSSTIYGWGRKKSGLNAVKLAKKKHLSYSLLEDGFIRSLGIAGDHAPSFSLVEDTLGIYYDATQTSTLEQILSTYDFDSDTLLMQTAKEAISLIKKHHISKYNPMQKDIPIALQKVGQPKILVIAQTANDSSLHYGLAEAYTTQQMILDAMKENPKASMYLKIHPDVLAHKKMSDIHLYDIPIDCHIIEEDINPIALLSHFDKVYTKTSGMGMEALIVGVEVVCYGMPYYAGWGLTQDKQHCPRRSRQLTLTQLFAGAYILYTKYHNPYSKEDSTIIDTIHTIIKYREYQKTDNGSLYLFGFTWWKRHFIKSFFHTTSAHKIIFCTSLSQALQKGLQPTNKIYIWGKKPFQEVEAYVKTHKTPLYRIEDGFVRSISLGSDLTKGYSMVMDSRGIYFDARHPSDLEYLLNTTVYNQALISRSKKLQGTLLKHKISKYNIYAETTLTLDTKYPQQTVALVVGQVSDDASIVYGAKGMSNLKLLKESRKNAPDAYIIYKPHPDVIAKNRNGAIEETKVLQYADRIITDLSIDSILACTDEVHTITSLVGFEALIRKKKVYTYGMPFYAGWGLTIDSQVCKRRKRIHSLDTLVATTLILYPRYIDPKTNSLCEIEVVLKALEKGKAYYHSHYIYRFGIHIRNFVLRTLQRSYRLLLPIV
ncbi:MAG: capsular polysaccharide biosynthesis protein [Sulfurovum sp.]|nr:capsular polysaccharide biosynthesis protein [Sulfurovum sp.]